MESGSYLRDSLPFWAPCREPFCSEVAAVFSEWHRASSSVQRWRLIQETLIEGWDEVHADHVESPRLQCPMQICAKCSRLQVPFTLPVHLLGTKLDR